MAAIGYDVTLSAHDRRHLAHLREQETRALLEVSRVAGASGSIEYLFGELSSTVARLVTARSVLFARVEAGDLAVQPRTHGFDDAILAGLRVPCSPAGNGLADRIVFQDEIFNASIDTGAEFEPYRDSLRAMGVSDAMAVSWRAGDLRLGLLAAFNSETDRGFTEEDVHILKIAAAAAGFVWHHKEAQSQWAEAQQTESERMTRAATEMVALEQTKTDFLQLASHEMRNPITTASVYASMLAEGTMGAVSERQRETLMIIKSKVDEVSRMVDQILEVARLEDPTIRLNLSTFDLRQIVPHAVEKAKPARASLHALTVAIGPDPIYVRADRERIQAVIANLVDNAFKYSPRGGQVRCKVYGGNEEARVEISDQGIGIAQEDLGRLFTRFSRVGGVQTVAIPGTGLGLYLCRKVARLQGGDVTVQSRMGEGTTFTLQLPAVKPG